MLRARTVNALRVLKGVNAIELDTSDVAASAILGLNHTEVSRLYKSLVRARILVRPRRGQGRAPRTSRDLSAISIRDVANAVETDPFCCPLGTQHCEIESPCVVFAGLLKTIALSVAEVEVEP